VELTSRTESAFPEKSHKMLRRRFVHLGKSSADVQNCKFRAVNCTKMRLTAGFRPDPLGELRRSPKRPNCYKGKGGKGRGRKGLRIGKNDFREGSRDGREVVGNDGKGDGRIGRERGKEREEEGKGRAGKTRRISSFQIFWLRPCQQGRQTPAYTTV